MHACVACREHIFQHDFLPRAHGCATTNTAIHSSFLSPWPPMVLIYAGKLHCGQPRPFWGVHNRLRYL